MFGEAEAEGVAGLLRERSGTSWAGRWGLEAGRAAMKGQLCPPDQEP